MTNKSEQDGDGSKTIEIGDMKYHIFQVCGSRCCMLLGGVPPPPGAPPWLCPSGLGVVLAALHLPGIHTPAIPSCLWNIKVRSCDR